MSGPGRPNPAPGDVAAAVSEDLSTIFAKADGALPHAPNGRRRSAVKTIGARPRRLAGGPPRAAGAVLAAGFVALGLGALALPHLRGAPAPTAPVSNELQTPSALPVVVAAAAPTAQPAATAPAPAGDIMEAPKLQAAASPRAHRPAPARVTKAVHRQPRASACGGDGCSHADLMKADRKLRRAYAQAVRAGVPRPVLVSYRNRWADLRRDSLRRPERVAVGYSRMAADLGRMAQSRSRRA